MVPASPLFPSRILVCLLAAIVPAGQCLAATANVSPPSGAGGRQVTLTSSGFDLDGVGYNTGFYSLPTYGLIGTCPVQNPANCSIQVNLPATNPGAFEIEANNSHGETDTATYNVASPQFSISPGCGPAGTTVTATGKFFAVGYDAALKFDGSYVATSNYPDANGTFSRSFVVPGGAADGNHPVLVDGTAGNTGFFQDFRIPCATVGEVLDLAGPVWRCVANCDDPDVGDRTRVPVNPGDPVRQEDRYETDAKGRVTFGFEDNTRMVLGAFAKFNVDDYQFDPGEPTHNTQRYTIFGGFYSFLSGTMNKNAGVHEVRAEDIGSIGIRGTWFGTRVDELAGQQEVYLSTGEITVTPDNTGLTTVFNGPVTVIFNADGVTSSAFVDGDADGVADAVDNCSLLANTSQCDSDGDGYGNRCDGDLGNPTPGNGTTNSQDYILFRAQLGQPSVAPGYNRADINCNGAVNSQDYILFRGLLGSSPGPSGLQP